MNTSILQSVLRLKAVSLIMSPVKSKHILLTGTVNPCIPKGRDGKIARIDLTKARQTQLGKTAVPCSVSGAFDDIWAPVGLSSSASSLAMVVHIASFGPSPLHSCSFLWCMLGI